MWLSTDFMRTSLAPDMSPFSPFECISHCFLHQKKCQTLIEFYHIFNACTGLLSDAAGVIFVIEETRKQSKDLSMYVSKQKKSHGTAKQPPPLCWLSAAGLLHILPQIDHILCVNSTHGLKKKFVEIMKSNLL